MVKVKIAVVAAMALGLGACASVGKPSQESVCSDTQAKKLIGTRNLDDNQIKQATGASIVRRTLPNQPLTRDRRHDRVTVVLDVATKQIISASCF